MTSSQSVPKIPNGVSKEFWQIPNNRYLYKQCKDLSIVLHDINKKKTMLKEPEIVVIVDNDDDVDEEEIVTSDDDEDDVQYLLPSFVGRSKDGEDDVQYRLAIRKDGALLSQTVVNAANTKEIKHEIIELHYPDIKDCFAIDTSGQLQSFERQFQVDKSNAKALDKGQIEICCWYRKEKIIKDLLVDGVINDQTFKFMRTRHQCRLDICLCCQECKRKSLEGVDITATKNTVKLEHMISILYNKQPLVPQKPIERSIKQAKIMYKVRQKYCSGVSVTDARAPPQHDPKVTKRKSFKNTILIISKLLPNDAKDIEIYIIGKTMTDVSCHLFLNYKDKNVLTSLSKTHNMTKSKVYEYNICCWFEREDLIKRLANMSAAPIDELSFLKKKHFCLFKLECNCCCKEKQKEDEATVDNEEISNVDNKSIIEEALIEDEIKIEIEDEVLLPLDPLQTENPIKEETESIGPSKVYSPKSCSASNITFFVPSVDNIPNAEPPKNNPTIQFKSSFLKALLDAKTPLIFPSTKSLPTQTRGPSPYNAIIPVTNNEIATLNKNPKLQDDSSETPLKMKTQPRISSANNIIPVSNNKMSTLKRNPKLQDGSSKIPLKKKTQPRVPSPNNIIPVPNNKISTLKRNPKLQDESFKIPLKKMNRPRAPGSNNIIPVSNNKISTLKKNPNLQDKSLAKGAKVDPPGPKRRNEDTSTNTLAPRKRNLTTISLEIIELRLKTFRSELLKLASLTDSHVKNVISDGFQNMIDNLRPNVEPVNDLPDTVKEEPEVVEDEAKFAEDFSELPDDGTIKKTISYKPGLPKKVLKNRNNKTISFKTTKVRKRKRPYRTEHIDEFEYSKYCESLKNFYKKLHL